MCGIIGIFGQNNAGERARQSLDKITHRGTSVFELESWPGGVLGANRLPIIDRVNGRQPKTNEDNTVFAVENGEIFNYKELKRELIAKGHIFKSDSDTEVLVHLYEEYGPEMIDKIDSEMFAFIIYDRKNNHIFAARDPLGVKPLYYAYDKTGQIYFASELKQLSFFSDVEKVYNFPPGGYYFKKKFKKYFKLATNNKLKDEEEVLRILERQIVAAVTKRVDTDLPVGVLLSGGVDSSLIMEIATRLHPDVTAIILGYPGSPDYEFALRLCRERKYKFHLIRPDVDYEKELDNLLYHLETYEPLIVRQSFALDICAREAQRLGLRVVLVGEGSDELFGGYNEFSALPAKLINQGCLMLTQSLNAGHLLRVDRMSMKHTVEVRSPFFDKQIIETALQIDGDLKIRRKDHQITTKYIIRRLAENFLPDYIAWRYKIPFSNGAGMNVGNNYKAQDGDVAKIVINKQVATLEKSLLEKYAISTKEEQYYLTKYKEFNYTKLADSEKRLVVKDNLNELNRSKKDRILVGEFGRLAIYFPAYFAAAKGTFGLHNLDIDFISTGGDDKTYASLVNNSAQIGLSDPMFAMFENKEGVKGEIIGELVTQVPNMAVSINPSVKISSLDDFKRYRVGTFQEFSTTNGIARYVLPAGTQIVPCDYQTLMDRLTDRSIDVAVVLPEQAFNLEALGGHIIFDFRPIFPKTLFSGFTIANILSPQRRKNVKSFVVAVREAVRYIKHNKEEAFEIFSKLFPKLEQKNKIFACYLDMWSNSVKVEKEDYSQAYKIWKTNYPELLKTYQPYFHTPSAADPAIGIINSRKYRRDFPFLEDVLERKIIEAISGNKPLKMVGFWGAGKKSAVGQDDYDMLAYFNQLVVDLQTVLPGKIEMTWILADEHARQNEYDSRRVGGYLTAVNDMLRKKQHKTVFLSALWKRWRISGTAINKLLAGKKPGWWNDVNIASTLEEQAKDRYQKNDKIKGAQKYYIMRKLEKGNLEKEFADAVFVAFTDGQMQSIYPKLPTIYLYTVGRGYSKLPWFSSL